jgi:signal transduction histidine kinase
MAVFQARARTVDMLGHQQVTDIATAISELFKNAHDAYAKEVAIDYLREEDLLVIHDDGIGMSPAQFQDRWLTLAGDNGAERSDPPKPPRGMKTRPIQGEKGIGRLAIATIGPQALVLTRPQGPKAELTVALINWGLFELPGINLGDVEIPVISYKGDKHPTETDLKKLVAQANIALKKLKLPKKATKGIQRHLSHFSRDLDPAGLLRALSKDPVTGGNHGTAFFISPTAPELVDDLDEIVAEANPPPGLLKTLIGFSNTMIPGAAKPNFNTVFRDHLSADHVNDAVSAKEFFTQFEFKEADHTFTGEFDEFGSFKGTISIYGGPVQKYVWTWRKAAGRDLGCGPFKLSVAYVQGEQKESRLDTARYAAIDGKLDRIGGLYVYRDGIRVLPYGDPAYDFLEFEQRRSLKAGRYYFSYRRMFGALGLSGEKNSALEEKAGREGFRSNRAYREFTALLKAFFVDVAAEFFTKEGESAEEFLVGREREKERHALLKEREAETKRRRKAFEKELAFALKAIDDEEPSAHADELLGQLEKRLSRLSGSKATRQKKIGALEGAAFEDLDDLRTRYVVNQPSGLGLSAALRREWQALQDANEELNALWNSTARGISHAVTKAQKEIGVEADRRGRLTEGIESSAERREADAHERSAAARSSLEMFDADTEKAIGKLVAGVVDAADAAKKASENGGGPLRSDKDLDDRREAIEAELTEATRVRLAQLESLAEQLAEGFQVLGTVEGSRPSLTAALEEELLDLRERSEQDLELAQVGMATQVISHELTTTVTSVREGLTRLSAWAEQNPGLRSVYDDLRASFDHLDAYLSLFTPLQRRLRRRRERLNGRGIEKFLGELFARRLKSADIKLESTKKFKEWGASGFRSDVYPALVNLVDNSIFWVSDTKGPRWIKLDAVGHDIIVSDSGPGIPTGDRKAIWEFGFTRKPRGRGAGLHIAQEVLKREGWSIELDKPKGGVGASFRISPPK